MNREIKFRGYSLKQRKWIYGSLYNGLQFADFIIENIGFEHRVRVVHESIGQYTGLKDKNGTEIYEGDILKYVDNWEFPNNDDTSHHLIYWDEKAAGFTDLRLEDGDSLMHYEEGQGISFVSYTEVVGNKFENPELINNKTK